MEPLQKESRPMKDMTYSKCEKCKKGTYQETSISDDWQGLLHCNNSNCRYEINRWQHEEIKNWQMGEEWMPGDEFPGISDS